MGYPTQPQKSKLKLIDNSLNKCLIKPGDSVNLNTIIMKKYFKFFNQRPGKDRDALNQKVDSLDLLQTATQEDQENVSVKETNLPVHRRILYNTIGTVAKFLSKVQRRIIDGSYAPKNGDIPSFKVKLKRTIETVGCDIRELSDFEISSYYNKKFKNLDFGDIFSKEYAEEQLNPDDFYDGDSSPYYTEEQWDKIVEYLFAANEYAYIEDFLRVLLQKVHDDFPELFEGISILPLNDENYDYGN